MTSPSQKRLSVGFLFDDSLDSTAGVAQYVKALGAWLHEQGHHTFYMVGETKLRRFSGGRVYSLARNVGVKFNANRLSTPLPTAKPARITRILADEQPDILHVQVPYSPFMSQRVIRRAPPDTAVVGTFCILPVGRLTSVGLRGMRPIYGQSLKRIKPMLAVSQAAADFAKQALGVESMILPNVINLKAFQAAEAKPDNMQRIVFLGRLVERKGAEQLLRAFRLLHNKLPEVELVIAGAGPELKSLKRFSAKHQLEAVVSFPGFVPESAKAGLLAQADVACFPSLYGESFGISLLEGMAASPGVVLGGDNPGYRSVLGAQPLSLIDPLDTPKFAARLERLLTDKALRQRLRKWQTAEVAKYDIQVIGPKLAEIYRQAIAKHRASR